MSARSRKTLERYRQAAIHFAEAARGLFGDAIRAVVLYGSVARGKAKPSSDIDILVIVRDVGFRLPLLGLAYDVDREEGGCTFTMPVVRTEEQVSRSLTIGSPFMTEVFSEGVALYDDGVFRDLHSKILSTGARVSPGRRSGPRA